MEKINGLADVALRATDGTIDVESTLAGVAEQLLALVEAESTLSGSITTAVGCVFDTHKGKVLPMPAVCSLAAGIMGVAPDAYNETVAAIQRHIRSNATFKVAKGKGGGVSRLADAPPKAE
jgi:hypothetical protein